MFLCLYVFLLFVFCDVFFIHVALVLYCLLLFFFFNQQTAYELRISDWSSDVCSSDLRRLDDFRAAAIPNVTDWQQLDMNYEIVALINQDLCIKCGLCHVACEDTSHQAIAAQKENGSRRYEVIDKECVGCNLCLHVCPVEGCITMVEVDNGKGYMNWTQDPRNPLSKQAAE